MVIRRPSEEVSAFVADLENWAWWQPDFSYEQDTRGSVEVGNAFRQGLEVKGQRIELLGEVIGYEKDEKLSFAYAGKPRPSCSASSSCPSTKRARGSPPGARGA